MSIYLLFFHTMNEAKKRTGVWSLVIDAFNPRYITIALLLYSQLQKFCSTHTGTQQHLTAVVLSCDLL